MSREHLATYVSDHAAGSAAAIELLKHLASTCEKTELGGFLAQLRKEIERDRAELQRLIDEMEIERPVVREVTGWLAGKLAELKMSLDDTARGRLQMLEGLEALELGIQGKLALWRALAEAARSAPSLRGIVDYEALSRRALDQIDQVEALRLEAARSALADAPAR